MADETLDEQAFFPVLRDEFERVVSGLTMIMDSDTAQVTTLALSELLDDPDFGYAIKDGGHDRRLAFATAATPDGIAYFLVQDNAEARVFIDGRTSSLREVVDALRQVEKMAPDTTRLPAWPGH